MFIFHLQKQSIIKRNQNHQMPIDFNNNLIFSPFIFQITSLGIHNDKGFAFRSKSYFINMFICFTRGSII